MLSAEINIQNYLEYIENNFNGNNTDGNDKSMLKDSNIVLAGLLQTYMGRDVGKIKIEFCIACSRGHSAGPFGTNIIYLAQFMTELLRNLSFKTSIMKN